MMLVPQPFQIVLLGKSADLLREARTRKRLKSAMCVLVTVVQANIYHTHWFTPLWLGS
jgi:ABC-type uncharacterized transport system substrate-binding protein